MDGYDKTGSGGGMSRKEWAEWSRRENEIVQAGWTLLRFANSRVRDEPIPCASNVALTLKREREVARRLEHIATPISSEVDRLRREALPDDQRAELKQLDRERSAGIEPSAPAVTARVASGDSDSRARSSGHSLGSSKRVEIASLAVAVVALLSTLFGLQLGGDRDVAPVSRISLSEAAERYVGSFTEKGEFGSPRTAKRAGSYDVACLDHVRNGRAQPNGRYDLCLLIDLSQSRERVKGTYNVPFGKPDQPAHRRDCRNAAETEGLCES